VSFFENALNTLFPGLASGVSTLSDAGAGLIAFFDTVTNGKMWRSLGWLLLGLVLIVGGLAMWVRAEVL
jgi:hypothetical protein